MYQTSINYSKYEINLESEVPIINGNPLNWDIINVGGNKYNIIYNCTSYNAELIAISEDKKSVSLKFDNATYELEVKDKFDQLLEKLGMTDLTSSKINDIKAPMPGLILSINVKVGDELKKGDNVMILEAMKMENVLKSPGEGIVKELVVKEGDSVDKNAVLIKF